MELRPHQQQALQGPDECWAEVRGWPEYLISNYGQVYSVRRGIIMTPVIRPAGYYKVIFRLKNVGVSKDIHRLVAEAFVLATIDDNNLEVNHINGDKLDNYEYNLEWVTHKQNLEHAFETGLFPRWKRRVAVNETGETFESINDCASHLGTTHGQISRVLRGERNSWKGYTFSYVD